MKTETDESGTISYKTAHNGDSVDHDSPSTTYPVQLITPDVASLVASDTASFKHRETELRSIEQRFGKSDRRQDHNLPATSRFHEEFDYPRISTSTRRPLFYKLRLHPMVKGRNGHKKESSRRVKSEGHILQDSLSSQPQETVNGSRINATQSSISLDQG